MPLYQAQYLEPAGSLRTARVQADDADAVAAVLGLPTAALLRVHAVPAARPRRRVDARQFCQELALLLQSGLPLLESIETLQDRDPSRQGLGGVASALRQGLPLSQAMAQSAAGFDELLCALVAASERTGQLVRSLQQHAAYLTWSEILRNRLVAAAVYPTLLLVLGLAVVVFLLLVVLPRFASVFDTLGDSVPAASRALVCFGVWVAAQPWAALALFAPPPLALVALLRMPAGRAALLGALWRSRSIGARWQVLVLARLYRALAVLLASGVPVPAALGLVRGVVVSPLRGSLDTAMAAVESGQRLSLAMQANGLATPVALRMLRVGEEAGELALMLERAATFHDEEIERMSELVTRAVNPLLMLLMGTLIGGIVVLMYLPIFTLMEQVQ